MLRWELKKIVKNKTSIIALILMGLLFIQIGFVKPMLETENEYFDESKNEYIVDKRPGDVIAQEKLDNKVNEIKSIANKNTHGLKDENEKQISKMSKEKLSKDNGEKYKDVTFYQVFENRATFPLATLLIVAIIVTLSSNLYTVILIYFSCFFSVPKHRLLYFISICKMLYPSCKAIIVPFPQFVIFYFF